MKIAVIIGSLRADSYNKKFVKSLEPFLPKDATLNYIDIANLPLFNQDEEDSLTKSVVNLKSSIEESDGVLLVTPEYNRGYSGVIKNAIDWGSRPWGKNSFKGKKVVIAGVSGGKWGTTQAQSQLKNVMLFLDTKVMGQPEAYINASEYFDDSGDISELSIGFARSFTNDIVAYFRGEKA